MSGDASEISKGEVKRFLGKDLEEFPPEQRETMLQLLQKIKERTKQAELLGEDDDDDDDEPTTTIGF
ncbi:MAG: hypothetical protein SFW36_00270 [Leptolyngbyaceae cyanobacterium bins.59]|nr:hypothetical protein [Leptolyngbyaceae cyanobacterium bins.59]